jgi:catalase
MATHQIAEKLKSAVSSDAMDVKQKQLAETTKDYHHPDNRVTTDYGVKYDTVDDWLKVASDDRTGPMTLEDPLGRERVCSPLQLLPLQQLESHPSRTRLTH